VSIDPAAVDRRSLSALRAAFRAAPDPAPEDLVGVHDAEFVGPRWLRAAAPLSMGILGMPGWCGKRFDPDPGDGVLRGANRARSRDGSVGDSIPITARVEPSRLDRRPALVVSYPADARFPWPRVRDEFRPFGTHTLLGMTFGIPLAPPGGTPFLLHRV
jgi:cholesterol oxidase